MKFIIFELTHTVNLFLISMDVEVSIPIVIHSELIIELVELLLKNRVVLYFCFERELLLLSFLL